MQLYLWVTQKIKLLKIAIRKFLYGKGAYMIYLFWQNGEKELEKFSEFLNFYHSNIKFTAAYSQEQITFPNVAIK